MSVRACDMRIRAWTSKRPSEMTDIEHAWLRHTVHGAAFDDFSDDGKRSDPYPQVSNTNNQGETS